MRIAVLSDIHGNLVGLDACLADLTAQGGADAVVAAGDLCLDGPKPKKVLQRLEEVGAQCLRGNTDRYLSDSEYLPNDEEGESGGSADRGAAESKTERRLNEAQIRWTRNELGERWVSFLRELPFALRIGEDENQLLIVHANPKSDDEHIWPDADDATLERFVGDEPAAAI